MGEIESRCVNIIARLFHAPVENAESQALGVSTIGSSEAIILSVSHPFQTRCRLLVANAQYVGPGGEEALAEPAQGCGQAVGQAEHRHERGRAGLLYVSMSAI